MLGRRPPGDPGMKGGGRVTLEEHVKKLIEDGVVAGSNGHATQGEHAEDGDSTPGWDDTEEAARESDLAQLEAWIGGIEKAVVTLARAVDELARRRG
jgi:hypothetical protein